MGNATGRKFILLLSRVQTELRTSTPINSKLKPKSYTRAKIKASPATGTVVLKRKCCCSESGLEFGYLMIWRATRSKETFEFIVVALTVLLRLVDLRVSAFPLLLVSGPIRCGSECIE